MGPEDGHPAQSLIRAFERPAYTVMMVCQMLLGLGLAVALILKVYMLIFSDQVCTADSNTLGNLIRCTGTLELVAHLLILVAGFRIAALMFSATPYLLLEPLLLALTGVLLLFLSDLKIAGATWFLSLILLVIFSAMSGIFIALRIWGEKPQSK
jgi:hypothetical protein